MPASSPADPSPGALPRPSGAGRQARASELRFADVRVGEGALVLGAMATLAAIVAGHVALETARDALFLTELRPRQLAWVYLAMAGLGLVVSRYERTVARVLGRTNALILALMGTGLGTFLFFLVDPTRETTFALYLWTGTVGTVVTVQFWMFLGARVTPAQARRLFGLVAAGGVLGAVLGGALSRLVAERLPLEHLLLLAAVLQLSAALVLTWAPTPESLSQALPPIGGREAAEILRKSPYARRVGALIVVATATLLVTDYLFKSYTATHVPSARLGPFLATFYTVQNAAALLVQVFLAMRVLQRAGTIFALTLLPLLLAFGGGALLVFGGSLLLILVTKGADGALRHSLHRVSLELLFLPLSPEQRSSAKPLFDSVLVRGAQGIAALGLLGLAAIDADSPTVLGGILLTASAIWGWAAFRLRDPYVDQFRRSLGTREARASVDLDQLTLDGVEVVIEALSSPEENRVLGAMGILSTARRTGLIPALVLYHPSSAVLVRALELIPSRERRDWIPLAERLVSSEDGNVRMAAVRALGRHGHLSALDPHVLTRPRTRATAAFFRARDLERPALDAVIAELCEPGALRSAQAALLRAIAEFGGPRWADVVLSLEALGGAELEGELPSALAATRDPRATPLLIARLGVRERREDARRALLSLGEEALDALAEALNSPTTPAAVLLHVPRSIARFGTHRAALMLLDALESDLPGAVRYKALRGLGRLVEDQKVRVPRGRVLALASTSARESLRAALLCEVLAEQLDAATLAARPSGELLTSLLGDKQSQSLERLLRLLQLLHPREDLRRVHAALTGRLPEAEVAAGELLEVLTLGYDEDLREMVRALADPQRGSERLARLARLLGRPVPDPTAALLEAIDDSDMAVSALAAEHARCLSGGALSIEGESRSTPDLPRPASDEHRGAAATETTETLDGRTPG